MSCCPAFIRLTEIKIDASFCSYEIICLFQPLHHRRWQQRPRLATVFECADGNREKSLGNSIVFNEDDNASPVPCHLSPFIPQFWAKAEGVGRDSRQNMTRTPSDFLWILNRYRGQPDKRAGTKKTRAISLKHPDMGPSSWPGDTEMGSGVRMTSGRLSILNILFSPLCPLVCGLRRLPFAVAGLIYFILWIF